ncbi:MAG: lipopolysaccharide heptosyltransferase family protein [Proteobacteria bacterium]|nr:lipopolysaccharide heptosyltransferase family protein [Pseudomonadota bacterium]
MAYNFDCRLFSGYKPCVYKRDCVGCPHYDQVETRIVIVSLEAMGAVLRSTVLLAPIKRRYPKSHITWITLKNTKALLDHNPYIDRVLLADTPAVQTALHLKFDLLLAVDKSLEAGALAERIKATEKRGFGLNSDGVIVPLNAEAAYQYDLGLNDQLKFFVNQKPETQQITETMGFEWARDPYVLQLTDQERQEVGRRRQAMLAGKAKGVIGYNTGCSLLFPYKKFTQDRAVEIIQAWRKFYPDWAVALLGGPEDTQRQQLMKAAFADDQLVINTPSTEGLRSGVLWMEAADLVLSGCSLGLHIALGLQKPSIAWFGVSCIQEIDVYDRGIKLQAEVSCSPCWRKSCDKTLKCYDQVSVEQILKATGQLIEEQKLPSV